MTPKYLYKYTPHNKCYKYDIVKKCELWFSKFSELNDPLDSNLAYRQDYSGKEIKTALEYFIEKCLNAEISLESALQIYGENPYFAEFRSICAKSYKSNIGVLCMSEHCNNILMWSHYANSHKGIVYEFEIKDLFSHAEYVGFSNIAEKMNYASEYELLSYAVIGNELKEQCERELLTKAIDWAYEKEYRYIDFQRSGAKKFNPKCLKSIIFGAKTENDEINAVMECCERNNLTHIQFKKARFIEGEFKLEFD